MASSVTEETRIIYHIDEEETPYLIKLNVPSNKVTLGDFKNALNRPNYKFFFKSMDDDFGVVKEEITDEEALLPCFNGRVVSWLVSAEGSTVSDSQSQSAVDNQSDQVSLLPGERVAGIGDSRPPSFHGPVASSIPGNGVGGPRTMGGGRPGQRLVEDSDTLCDTCTDTDSVYSANQDRVPPLKSFNDYRQGMRSNGHHRNGTYDTASSMMSSDVETTSFFDSEDESSRFSTATGTTMSSARYGRHKQQRRRRRMPPISRASSFSSITDSTMSLNVVTVTLNMDTVNFLGISIVGQSNKGGDGGIYVGSIMKGGAVAQDGRIEPGDMILEVNGISFEDMSNDDAVRTLREQVQKPGPITLVVAKCWNPNPKDYFTIPRQEPVRPIDPRAWVLHTNAMTNGSSPNTGPPQQGQGQLVNAPSMSTMFSGSASTATGMTMPAGASAAAFTTSQMQQQHQHGGGGGGFFQQGVGGGGQMTLQSYGQGAPSVVTTSSSLPESDRYLEQVQLTVNTDVANVVRAMAQPDSGLEIRDRLWLKITLPNAFIGSDLVDWLYRSVEGFSDRRDARKYACNLLKLGYIRHTVNKVTFSEQCYYVFGDIAHTLSRLSLEEVDSVSEADRDRLAPLPPPNWGNTASTALSPLHIPASGVGLAASMTTSLPAAATVRSGGVGGSSSGTSNYSQPGPPPSYGVATGGEVCDTSVGCGPDLLIVKGSSQYSSLSGLYQTGPTNSNQQRLHLQNAASCNSLSGSSSSSSRSCGSRGSGEKPLLSAPQPPPRTTTALHHDVSNNPSTFRMPMGNTAM